MNISEALLALVALTASFSHAAQIDRSSTSAQANTRKRECPRDKFRCESSNLCITHLSLCDGYSDCWDGSDERNCSTSSSPRTPIPIRTTTKGLCRSDQFRCTWLTQCFPWHIVCDGRIDCLDRSDERNCQGTTQTFPRCPSSEFMCDGGRCVSLRYRCDGQYYCQDRSDERYCNLRRTTRKPFSRPTCDLSSYFLCTSRDCIPPGQRCDGKFDCEDGSDESYCDTSFYREKDSSPKAGVVPGFIVSAVVLVAMAGVIYWVAMNKCRTRSHSNSSSPIPTATTHQEVPTVSSHVFRNTADYTELSSEIDELPPSYEEAYQFSTPSIPKPSEDTSEPPSYLSVVISSLPSPPPPPYCQAISASNEVDASVC